MPLYYNGNTTQRLRKHQLLSIIKNQSVHPTTKKALGGGNTTNNIIHMHEFLISITINYACTSSVQYVSQDQTSSLLLVKLELLANTHC